MKTKILIFTSLFLAMNATAFSQVEGTEIKEEVIVKEAPQAQTMQDTSEIIYQIVEVQAQFPGGMDALYQYLSKNLKYPDKARDAGIQGIVYVQFVIEKDGSITNVQVKRGVHPLLDEASLEAVKHMPNWIPGTQRGRPVRSIFILPVQFQLAKETAPSQKKK
jgi:periplasmic protein TonB